MTRIPPALLRSLPLGPLRTVRRFKADPVGVQRRLLSDLVLRAANTEFGRLHHFDLLREEATVVAGYQSRVPLQDYDSLRPFLDRVRGGEANVLWPGTFRNFAVSSGTASTGKIIPVSSEMLGLNSSFGIGVALNCSARTGDAAMWLGKMLSLPGRVEPYASLPGAFVGEVSGLQSMHSPTFVSRFYQAVPHEILFVDNWDRKLDAVAEHTVDLDIRTLAMAPTWAVVLFEKLIARYNATHGAQARTVTDVWPNLRVFFSGGVALSSYRDLLEDQIGGPIQFIESYGASEGFFSFQDDPGASDMLLHLDNGVFYEFVPLDQLGTDQPARLTIGEVRTGVRYALHVSSCSGLWSYCVGDVVRFTSLQPHRIVVAGRTSEMIDRYGEAVFGEEARRALEVACKVSGALFVDYHIAPRVLQAGGIPGHQWLIEFDREPADLGSFSRLIDEYMQKVNRHYQIRREARAFDSPEIRTVPRGTFLRWLEETRDRVSAQTKVPRMSEERHVADGVLRSAATMGVSY